MTDETGETLTFEREFPHPPEKLWRALTQPHLLSEWLMKTDFIARQGHHFRFSGDWGGVDCVVLKIVPQETLSYSWGDVVLNTVVTWTLTPTRSGTRLRMEQTGFPATRPRYLDGARFGWPRFLDNLQSLLDAEV